MAKPVTNAKPAAKPVRDERVKQTSLITNLLRRPEFGALLGALAIFMLFSAVDTTGKFGQPGGIAGWTDIAAPIGIIAVFVALLMIGGEFDLSTGVMVGTAGLLTGMLVTELGLDIWTTIVLVLIFGAGIGLLNGWLVVTTGLPSFIVTLATFFILRGANLAVTKAFTGTVRVSDTDKAANFDQAAAIFATKIEFLGASFQVTVLWWIGFTILATWILTRTKFGNWIFASGGDPNAARNAGVPVIRTKITLFVMTAMASSLVGIMLVLRLKGMQAGQGVGMEFFYIIAAAVGGTLLTGGKGSAIGASIGAAVMGMAYIGIPFALWDSDWTFTFLGVILFTAVLINSYVGKRAMAGKGKK
jgi:simple sugar transport system permease protein